MQRLYYLIGLLLGFIILLVSQLPSEQARMIVCDVGQGDAILIIKGSNQALIDGGPSGEKILSCLEKYVPFWDRQIELIVLTNSDSDHMSGLSAVVDRYSVMQFITSDGVHATAALERFWQVLIDHQVGVVGVEQGDAISLGGEGGLRFEVVWPPQLVSKYMAVFSDQISVNDREQILRESANRGDLNERSVVLLLLEGTTSVLLTGDAGFQTEKVLLSEHLVPTIDVLKVGHHGSKYASSLEFLEATAPSRAIISVGAQNRYGHPTKETLDRLGWVGAAIWRTDIQGDAVIEL